MFRVMTTRFRFSGQVVKNIFRVTFYQNYIDEWKKFINKISDL